MRLRDTVYFGVILVVVHLAQGTRNVSEATNATAASSKGRKNDDSYYEVKNLSVEIVKFRDRYVRFKWTAPTYYYDHFKQYSYLCTYDKWSLNYESEFISDYQVPGKIAPGKIQSFDIQLWMEREIRLYCAIRTEYKNNMYPFNTISNRSNIATVTLPPLDNFTGSAAHIMLTVVLPIVCIVIIVVAISLCVCRRRSRARRQESRTVLLAPAQVHPYSLQNPVNWLEQGQQHPNATRFPPPYSYQESSNTPAAGCIQHSNYGPPPVYQNSNNSGYQSGAAAKS